MCTGDLPGLIVASQIASNTTAIHIFPIKTHFKLKLVFFIIT